MRKEANFSDIFQHRMIHRYTWSRRDEKMEQESVINCTAMHEKLRKDVLDTKVVRGSHGCCDK